MTPSEVAELLSLSVELDRYMTADKATKEKVIAWAAVLGSEAPGLSFAEAQRLVIEYYGSEGESLTVFALIDLWKRDRRLLPHQVAADVRSAKARGLVSRDWPEGDALPAEVADRLSAARAGDRDVAGGVGAAGSRLALQVGGVCD